MDLSDTRILLLYQPIHVAGTGLDLPRVLTQGLIPSTGLAETELSLCTDLPRCVPGALGLGI